MAHENPERDWPFASPDVVVARRGDRTLLIRSPHPLHEYPRSLGMHLEHWARTVPDRVFLQERGPKGEWSGPTYAEARESVWRIATWLVRSGALAERPVAILSDNSVEQALFTLAAMHVGVPVAPVSPAYSLQSSNYVRLKSIIDQVRPGVIYVVDHARFGAALAAIRGRHDARVISGSATPESLDGCVPFEEVMHDLDADAVDRRFRQTGPDSVAKLMFTSGSTGDPKGVITTQRMLCSNQQARMQVWPFLQHEPPVLVDWLPWSHTFGGNHNFNLALACGGTLYVDSGRPAPGLFDTTITNLRDIAPTIYFNVPRGYHMLVPVLQRDERLRQRFFSRLRVIFFAAAALPQHSVAGALRPVRRGRRRTHSSLLGLGHNGDGATRHRLSLPSGTRGGHWSARAGNRAETHCRGRAARDPSPRAERDAWVLEAARPHNDRV